MSQFTKALPSILSVGVSIAGSIALAVPRRVLRSAEQLASDTISTLGPWLEHGQRLAAQAPVVGPVAANLLGSGAERAGRFGGLGLVPDAADLADMYPEDEPLAEEGAGFAQEGAGFAPDPGQGREGAGFAPDPGLVDAAGFADDAVAAADTATVVEPVDLAELLVEDPTVAQPPLGDAASTELPAPEPAEPPTAEEAPAPAETVDAPAALLHSDSIAAAAVITAAHDRESAPTTSVSHENLPLADFDHVTIGSLRSRLRSLDPGQLAVLRDYERAHGNRLPVLLLLENRIAKLAAAAAELPAQA